MIRITPIRRALVPLDSAAAHAVADRNYDEFQGDQEIWERLQSHPESILRVTMSHCETTSADDIIGDGSQKALARSEQNMRELIESPLTRIAEDALWIYKSLIRIGLAFGRLDSAVWLKQARLEPKIRPMEQSFATKESMKSSGQGPTHQGHSVLYRGRQQYIRDPNGVVAHALETIADSRSPDYETTDEKGYTHRSWIETDADTITRLTHVMAQIPCAYVADGNHRSAAAAHLGRKSFLNVLFPTDRMGLAPYNRLVKTLADLSIDDFVLRLESDFDVSRGAEIPQVTHHTIGLYMGAENGWLTLKPKAHTYDPQNAVEVIDSDIIQRRVFDAILGIEDARDERLNFVEETDPFRI